MRSDLSLLQRYSAFETLHTFSYFSIEKVQLMLDFFICISLSCTTHFCKKLMLPISAQPQKHVSIYAVLWYNYNIKGGF